MPSWNEILTEIQSTAQKLPNGAIAIDYDGVRTKYISAYLYG